jgi:hypothetical protein
MMIFAIPCEANRPEVRDVLSAIFLGQKRGVGRVES